MLMSLHDISAELHIGKRTLWRWISAGTFPGADLRIGLKVLRWRRETVQAWIDRVEAAKAAS